MCKHGRAAHSVLCACGTPLLGRPLGHLAFAWLRRVTGCYCHRCPAGASHHTLQACPAACLHKNARGQAPVEVAVACQRGEVLNAMLLACAGDAGGAAVAAMKKLLQDGAVPDTWAPNGSSALMLAAAANGTQALEVGVDV